MMQVSNAAERGVIGLRSGGTRFGAEAVVALERLEDGDWTELEAQLVLAAAERLVRRGGGKRDVPSSAALRERAVGPVVRFMGPGAFPALISALGSGDPPLQARVEAALIRLLENHELNTALIPQLVCGAYMMESDSLRRTVLALGVANPSRETLVGLVSTLGRRRPGEIRWSLERAAVRMKAALDTKERHSGLLRPLNADGESLVRPVSNNQLESDLLVRPWSVDQNQQKMTGE